MRSFLTKGVLLAAAGNVAVTAALIVLVPSFEKPDEPGHLDYIRFLAREHRLPGPLKEAPYHESFWQGLHPPLYHALGAAWLKAADRPGKLTGARWKLPAFNRNSPMFGGNEVRYFRHPEGDRFPYRYPFNLIRSLRLPGLLFGLGTVLATAYAAGPLFGAGSAWALLAVVAVALSPQVCFIAGSISNDGLAMLLGALVTALGLRIMITRKTPRPEEAAALGLLAALAMLTRTAAGAAAVFGLACLLAAGGKSRGRSLALFLAAALLPVLWLPVRNLLLYGDLTGWKQFVLVHAAQLKPHTLLSDYFLSIRAGSFPVRVFESFWGCFGWMNLKLPAAIYLALAGMTGLAVAGLGIDLGKDRPQRSRPLALLGLPVVIAGGLLVLLNLSFTQPQGRYLFPALVPLALLLAAGLRHAAEISARLFDLDRKTARQLPALVTAAVAALLLVANAAGLAAVIQTY